MDDPKFEKLIEKARAEGKWLQSQGLAVSWSPDELLAERAAGRFRWSADNFVLIDPQILIDEAKAELMRVSTEYADIIKRVVLSRPASEFNR